MARENQMHLGLYLSWGGEHIGGWRLPEAEHGAEKLDVVVRGVQAAERGKFDFVFSADGLATTLDFHPSSLVHFEPLTLLSALSVLTSRIGLASTVSTTYSEPYNVARLLASLDHLSNGRAGWNVVTGSQPEAAWNFGKDTHPDQAERYAIAKEYLEAIKGLWDSWEDGAIVENKETGQYIDADKLHILDHVGEHFRIKGPLNITRPPQGYPVIMQAGGSEAGLDFAARTAEVVFVNQTSIDDAIEFRKDLQDRCERAGRPRNAIKVLPGLNVYWAETEDAGKAKLAELASFTDRAAAMKVLSERLGQDLSAYPLDGPVPDLPPSKIMQGHANALKAIAKREQLTLGELLDYAAAGSGHRVLYGPAEKIADDMEEWFRRGAADGFMLKFGYVPRPIEEFVEHVVPVLQKRGLFREDYQGTTLREHLGLSRPPHPAAATRGAAVGE
ncbi:LLM class flavin-dependent oxidoreductase [Roseovarius pacificus]|uniref:LLM class flavin-dependent oxidoreductase n=1 Tax=Roseovarius pacificus TaxID=337701 RepID=UPI002A1869CF|nr:LLM class flavin-dependent oxidoreductase [Roseovarius pacificus]